MPVWIPGRGNQGISEWRAEEETEWSWGTEERKSPTCPSLYSEETEAEVVRMRCARNLGFCEAYATRVQDLSPPHTYARAQAQKEAYSNLITKVKTLYASPGRGDRQKLPRLSHFKRYVQQKIAMEYVMITHMPLEK